MRIKPWPGEPSLYALAVALCLAALCLVMQLWRADLRVPLQNQGDAIESQLYAANALASGWSFHNDRLGAPYGMDSRDYPTAYTLHLVLVRALGLVVKDVAVVVNVFFLLTFVLTTLTALAVLRHFGLGRLPALAGSLLYAFLPYHFWRGEAHLFLGAYYMVPPAVLAALWVYLGRLGRDRKRWLFALVICLLVSSAGVYYAFFATFFLLVAGMAAVGRERKVGPLVRALALAGTIGLGLGVNLLPCYLYQREQGANAATTVARRGSFQAEAYGLKMAQLVLPVTGHRLRFLRQLKEDYNREPYRPLVNDFGSSLGTVGTAGCAFLLAALLWRRGADEGSAPLTGLGVLFVSGLLLGMIGGLGSLFAFLISPQIRCYDRVSIYLGFFALFGAAWALQALMTRAVSWQGRLAGSGLCLAVLAGGLWDQTVPVDVTRYGLLKHEDKTLAEFTARIEEALPPGAMVLQLPCWPYDDVCGSYRMSCTDHFRLYLHSRSLRWSHGGFPGRYGRSVLADLADLPAAAALDRAVEIGYLGIHIDRFGYADQGQALEVRLRDLLGAEPLVSRDERDVFFDLQPYAERYRQKFSYAEWTRRQESARLPPWVRAGEGCAEEYRSEKRREIRCSPRGALRIVNPSSEGRRVVLHLTVRTLGPGPAYLTFSGPLLEEMFAVDGAPRTFTAALDVPPGEHALSFACDAEVYSVRKCRVAFVLSDLALVPEEPGRAPAAEERSLNWGTGPRP
jgi:phosphoglycerol transferase